MDIRIEKSANESIAVVRGNSINDAQDALDLIATVSFTHGCRKIAVYKEDIVEDFFDLSTKIAGEVLQKFVNYMVSFAIIGDFSGYTSKSLKDFIYECNKGRHIFFAPDEDTALNYLRGI